MSDTTAHALYRFYGDDGALLYVGITLNPGGRFKQHAADKPWWHEVRGITMEPYTDRASVLAAESRAILVENPRYNIQRPRAHRPPRPTRPQIVWLCNVCADPINDGQGYLEVDMLAVRQVEEWCYWFAIERARTHAQLLLRTAHLMEKNWLEHTDWHLLIGRMAGVDA